MSGATSDRGRWTRELDRQTLMAAVIELEAAIWQLEWVHHWDRIQPSHKGRRHLDDFFQRSEQVLHALDLYGLSEFIENAEALRRQHRACVHCGSDEQLSVDHIHPQSRGGGPEMANLQVLCKRCNSSKGARTMEEWLASDAPRARLKP
jgi:hypothetical protein